MPKVYRATAALYANYSEICETSLTLNNMASYHSLCSFSCSVPCHTPSIWSNLCAMTASYDKTVRQLQQIKDDYLHYSQPTMYNAKFGKFYKWIESVTSNCAWELDWISTWLRTDCQKYSEIMINQTLDQSTVLHSCKNMHQDAFRFANVSFPAIK